MPPAHPPPTDQTKKCVQCLGIVCDLASPLLAGLSSLTNCTVRHMQSRLTSHSHAHKLCQNFSLQYTSLIIYGPTRVDTPPIESLLVSFPVLSGNQAKHAEDMYVGLSKLAMDWTNTWPILAHMDKFDSAPSEQTSILRCSWIDWCSQNVPHFSLWSHSSVVANLERSAFVNYLIMCL